MIEGQKNNIGKILVPGVLSEIYIRYSKGEEKWPWELWPLDDVLEVFFHIYGILSENSYKINPGWDETTAQIARIILSEKGQAEFLEAYNNARGR